MLGTAYHLVGRQVDAQRHCDRGFAIVAASDIEVDYFGYDHRVRASIVMARSLWIQGRWDRGLNYGRRAIAEAESRGRPVSLCIALIYTATALLWNRSLDEAEAVIERLIKHATRNSLDPYHACGLVLRGELRGAQGDHETAIEHLRSALSRLNAENHRIMNSGALRALAESLMNTGQLSAALRVIDGAVDAAGQAGGKFDLAELYRIQGEIRLRSGDVDGAHTSFSAGTAVADEQNAVSWRLRSGEALARLWLSRGRADEARAEASTLLARLGQCGPGDPLIATRDALLALLSEAGAVA
jgi:ATP/maltotriose-dependent transcriptional regulator MalT